MMRGEEVQTKKLLRYGAGQDSRYGSREFFGPYRFGTPMTEPNNL